MDYRSVFMSNKIPGAEKKITTGICSIVAFIMVAGCCSTKAESKGQEHLFDARYETVTNKLSALKLNPAVRFYIPAHGHEIVTGQSFEYSLSETVEGPTSGTYTTIIATRIAPKSTRVQIKTIKRGIIFNSRDRRIEKRRLNELSQLLAAPASKN